MAQTQARSFGRGSPCREGQAPEKRPWWRFARHFFMTVRPLLACNDLTADRTASRVRGIHPENRPCRQTRTQDARRVPNLADDGRFHGQGLRLPSGRSGLLRLQRGPRPPRRRRRYRESFSTPDLRSSRVCASAGYTGAMLLSRFLLPRDASCGAPVRRVLARRSSSLEKLAAREVRRYVYVRTGVAAELLECRRLPADAVGVVVGCRGRGLVASLGVSVVGKSPDAYRLKTVRPVVWPSSSARRTSRRFTVPTRMRRSSCPVLSARRDDSDRRHPAQGAPTRRVGSPLFGCAGFNLPRLHGRA